ncbi:MAG TPA: hypothetical protein VHH36_06100 [Candidatus Thermoplasmatota archaeon]|nr:hypothetical protein [Candidatus Thermoplasmatota archaeon]
MRAATVTVLALLAAPFAFAQAGVGGVQVTDKSGDCPENVPSCGEAVVKSYAQTTVKVGPIMVVATLRVDDGNDELEVNATARAGDTGEITFRVEDASGNFSGNATVEVTLRVDVANATLAWEGATEASFAFDPRAGPADRTFRFQVPADAPTGKSIVPFLVAAGNETATSGVGIEVVPAERNESPAPAFAAVAAAAVLALALRRRTG